MSDWVHFAELNKKILGEFLLTVPHKMDENIWRSRQQLEEILHLIEPSNLEAIEVETLVPSHSPQLFSGRRRRFLCVMLQSVIKGAPGTSLGEWKETTDSIRNKANSTFERLQEFQKAGMQKVQHIISTFLPNDFRMSIVKAQQVPPTSKTLLSTY